MNTPHHLERMNQTPPPPTPANGGCYFCDDPAQPEHKPCCSTHNKPLCCDHYCRAHFVQVDQCSPETHARVKA